MTTDDKMPPDTLLKPGAAALVHFTVARAIARPLRINQRLGRIRTP